MNTSLFLKIAAVLCYVGMCTTLVVTTEEPAPPALEQAAAAPLQNAG